MSKWHKGLPPKKGKYIFGFKSTRDINYKGEIYYWEMDGYFDPAKQSHPYQHHTFKNDLVAWRNYPKFDKKVERFL